MYYLMKANWVLVHLEVPVTIEDVIIVENWVVSVSIGRMTPLLIFFFSSFFQSNCSLYLLFFLVISIFCWSFYKPTCVINKAWTEEALHY
jgi:hypothetical protein